jgi:hypothetical protein
MIMVLLVLKLFVSSRPLKLEGVLCIYVLLFHEGQAENHFDMFFHIIWTHVWLSMFYYSWSFVCVNFHVTTWLLSFYCENYVSYAHILSSLIPALNALHRWSRLCWCMSPQKLLFCYHLPTRGRAGVSACLFELQLNEKQLELDSCWNTKMLFGNLLLGRLVDM